MKKIGILGGGQLGRMMIQAALSYDVEIHILDPDPEAPCRSFCQYFTYGDFGDFDTVFQFGKDLDAITIEIEKVNVDALDSLLEIGKTVFPQPSVIRTIQDKRTQKNFYQAQNIKTPPFVLVDRPEDVAKNQSFLPAFYKVGKGGYDGKGVFKLDKLEDLPPDVSFPGLLEKKVAIEKEISVIIARNKEGDVQVYPPVESVFDPVLNLVDYLLAPANISSELAQEAEDLARQVIASLDMVGLLAIEMFLDTQGQLWVNEAAPRAHNSGHHSIEANYTSQFEQLIRALLDLPLGSTQTREKAAMVNLIGEKGAPGPTFYQGLDQIMQREGIFVHLYGKRQCKPGRKMGHVTILHKDKTQLIENIEFVKATLKVQADSSK
ncbi:MAG: 5-(carboxyamino)imidazole ribonucleotide synthase [Bacteroidota bacterium]